MTISSDSSRRLIEERLDSHVIAASWLGDNAHFVLADGRMAMIGADARAQTRSAGGAVLVAAVAKGMIATGSDDGCVRLFKDDGPGALVGDEQGRWIDALTLREDGALAWSVGKQVKARDGRGETRTLTSSSSVRGLSFFPKGYRLAIGGYNGVTLWFPNLDAEPERLEWRGSHLDVTVSPDGRFVVSTMQENALHGWRVADRKNMRMTGYPGKTRSLSWSMDGDWLATSGAEACVIWPFAGKDGPMGKPPRECGVHTARVSRVAFHPRALQVAVGYEDGWILFCRLDAEQDAPVRVTADASTAGAVSALAWSADGKRLLYGTQAGAIGMATIS
jgi:WD40 repeat protein